MHTIAPPLERRARSHEPSVDAYDYTLVTDVVGAATEERLLAAAWLACLLVVATVASS